MLKKRLTIFPSFAQVTQDVTKELRIPSDIDVSSILSVPNSNFLIEEDQNATVEIGQDTFQGRLVSSNDNCVVLQTPHDLLTLRHYNSIILANEKVVVFDPEPKKVSYLDSSISWNTDYVIFTEKDVIRNIIGRAIIKSTRPEFPAVITFASGNFSRRIQSFSENRSFGNKMAMASLSTSDDVPEESFADNVSYPIGKQLVDVLDQSTFTIIDTVPESKKYFYLNVQQNRKNLNASFGYRVTSKVHLPSGRAKIYDELQKYIGETTIATTPLGVQFDMLIGESGKTSADITVTQKISEEAGNTRTTFTINVVAKTDFMAPVIFSYYIGSTPIENISSGGHVSSGKLEYLFDTFQRGQVRKISFDLITHNLQY